MKYGAIESNRGGLMRSQSQVEMSSPKLLSKKKEHLPPIDSPFLKKTVYQLFSDKSEKKVMKMREKEDSNGSSFDIGNQFTVTKEVLEKDRNYSQSMQKITKSVSEVKHSMKETKYQNPQKMKNSIGVRSNVNESSKRRNTTETSEKKKPQPKIVYRKILKIR